MEAPKDTKPFNLEHARAGAPFCCANGDEVEILKWDRKHTFSIIGIAEQDAAIRKWRSDGSYAPYEESPQTTFDLVMTPLGYIDGKPVFVGDKVVTPTDMEWIVTPNCSAEPGRSLADCRWPAPEKQYPVTGMGQPELNQVWCAADGSSMEAMRAVANAALRHAVDAGQVVPAEDVRQATIQLEAEREKLRADLTKERTGLIKAENMLEQAGYRYKGGEWTRPNRQFYGQMNRFYVEGDESSIKVVQDLAERGAARDMAVAEAVRDACHDAVSDSPGRAQRVRQLDVSAIIAKVKP